jgi:hypothetical protein
MIAIADQIIFFSKILATSVHPRRTLRKRATSRSKKHSFPLVMPGQPLHPSDEVPRNIRDLLVRARTSWLKSEHVLDILTNYLCVPSTSLGTFNLPCIKWGLQMFLLGQQ